DGLAGDPLPLRLSACPGLSDAPRVGDISAQLETERLKLIEEQCRLARHGWTVVFCLNTEGSRARFLEASLTNFESIPSVSCVNGRTRAGCPLEERQPGVRGERDLYGLRKPIRNKYDPHAATRRKGNTNMGSRLSGWTEIEPGEWVVHLDHGIGKYLGL